MRDFRQQLTLPNVCAAVAGATTGAVILCGSAVAQHGWPKGSVGLFHAAVEKLSLPALLCLFISGFCFGLFLSRPLARIAVLWQLAAFPIAAFAEILHDPTSHNLWPFELLIYAFLTGIGWLGMKLANMATDRLTSE